MKVSTDKTGIICTKNMKWYWSIISSEHTNIHKVLRNGIISSSLHVEFSFKRNLIYKRATANERLDQEKICIGWNTKAAAQQNTGDNEDIFLLTGLWTGRVPRQVGAESGDDRVFKQRVGSRKIKTGRDCTFTNDHGCYSARVPEGYRSIGSFKENTCRHLAHLHEA